MADNDIVQVDIDLTGSGVPREGFGMALIVSHNAPWTERVRLYEAAADAVTDGYASDSPEVRALTRIFQQENPPPLVAIGRAAAEVIQRYEVALAAVGPRDGFTYQILVKGEGFEDALVEVVSDDNATDDEILTALVTELNQVDGKTFTAALVPGGSDPSAIEITGDDPGNWFSIEVVDASALSNQQTHTVTGLGDDLDAILNASGAWYALLTLFNSKDYVADASEWASANGRIYAFDVVDTDVITETLDDETSTDVGATLLELSYTGVLGSYHQNPAAFYSAGWMGDWLTTIPGQGNPAFRELVGVEPSLLTATQKANLLARRMNYHRRAYRRNFTWQGMVFSTTYKWIDVRRNIDWTRDEIAASIAEKLLDSEIIGFDNPGLQVLSGAAREALARGTAQGVFASEPPVAVTVPLASGVAPIDKSDRALRLLKWTGTLRGAINSVVPVKGTISF